MADARLAVRRVGPLVTLQDGGRRGRLRYGIPASGPMDRLAHAAGNTVLGNDAKATSIEVSRAGVALTCGAGSVTLAVTGVGFEIVHNSTTRESPLVLTLQTGDQLEARAGTTGNWAYIGVAGFIEAKTWLGHTATHTQSGFGGGVVRQGQELVISGARVDRGRDGPIAVSFMDRDAIRIVRGPQDRHFAPEALEGLVGSTYRISEAADRMGVRLDGKSLALRDALSIPSEPIIRGSIQVAGDGVPTVLLADHQTTGGYPKVATVISSDVDRFAQKRPGAEVNFELVSPEEAVVIARDSHRRVADYLDELSQPTLTQRLFNENLIGWPVPEP